ncbi:MAG: hypothetical protein IKU40_10045 [Clostridia bacterium]|nr:hypothetical protein [Clostridia bacterium]
MKKILSLALALLMLLPMAIGTSAAKKSDDVVTADEFMSLINYWQWLNDEDRLNYSDLYDYIYGSKHHDDDMPVRCGVCGKNAVQYISKGDVYCYCKHCNEIYPIELPKAPCKDCGKKDCECVDPGFTISPEVEFNGKFNHRFSSCELNDIDFYRYGSFVYWYCDNCGNAGKFSASHWDDKWYDYFWDYDIRVLCSRGGSYDIDGRLTADHGDTRTITFDPDYGYVLYNVTVNGEDYGPVTTIKLTITENTTVRAEFVKASSLKPCELTATAIGNGTITAKKNGVKVAADEITAKYNDSVVYTFKPASSNYVISDVTVNGRSIGKVNTYSLTKGITKDLDIKVTFTWKSPYNDVADNYLKAVEYVTEAGIMGYNNMYVNKNAFSGKTNITIKSIAAALAEMADVNEKLDTIDERVEWAVKNAVIDESADLTAPCTVQIACDIVNNYLALIEKAADINFSDFDADDSAKDNALSIGLVKETTYTKNRTLTRYDLASVCYLIANLDVK